MMDMTQRCDYDVDVRFQKQQILDKLTSSKNERIVFEVVWDMTIGSDKVSRLILNEWYYLAGVSTRKALNLAVNRLMDENKNLIFKVLDRANNHGIDVYRYQINKRGCVEFLNNNGELNET